jgi:hypothetical protein
MLMIKKAFFENIFPRIYKCQYPHNSSEIINARNTVFTVRKIMYVTLLHTSNLFGGT